MAGKTTNVGNTKVKEFHVEIDQPAELVWQIHIKNFQATMPAALAGHFSRIEYLEGPPLAPGGVFKICYEESSKNYEHYDYVSFIWDEIDHDKYTFQARIVDGGFLGTHFDHVVYHYEIRPGKDANSCVTHWKIEYLDSKDHDFHDFLADELIGVSKSMASHGDDLNKKGQCIAPSKASR